MKFTVLLSSGIDSPVAAYLVSNYAEELIFVHADVQPYTDNSENTVFLSIAEHLSKKLKKNTTAYLISHGPSLKNYIANAHPRYTCVFCKRMLLRYASTIAELKGADALVMGDSLGQVASQTLQNIQVIDEVTSLPILRPIIGFDKEDIIKIAKDIGTFDLSTMFTGSCQAVPNKPATSAKLRQLHAEEEKIDIDSLVDQAITDAKKISF